MKGWVMGLAAANVVAWAWGGGYLSPLLEAPGAAEREPLRLSRQLQPESVIVVPPGGVLTGVDAVPGAASASGSGGVGSALSTP
jgi:hypothetical protein